MRIHKAQTVLKRRQGYKYPFAEMKIGEELFCEDEIEFNKVGSAARQFAFTDKKKKIKFKMIRNPSHKKCFGVIKRIA